MKKKKLIKKRRNNKKKLTPNADDDGLIIFSLLFVCLSCHRKLCLFFAHTFVSHGLDEEE